MENKNNYNGLLLGLLTILFIGLKLTGIIAWSWFWVLSPILIPNIIALILLLLIEVAEKIKK